MINRKKFVFFIVAVLLLAGCETPKEKPKPPTTYTGYFRILLRSEISEYYNEHTFTNKHLFVQSITDTFLFADLSQRYYEPLTDSIYYVDKTGSIVKFENIDQSYFMYWQKYFPLAKSQE